MNHERNWTLFKEKDFIDNLGLGRWHIGSDRQHSRAWWLRQYLKVAKIRHDTPPWYWDAIEYAKLLLSKIGKRG